MRLGQGLAVAVAVVASWGVAQCAKNDPKALIKANFKRVQVNGASVYLSVVGDHPCTDADGFCAKFGMRVATVDMMTRDLYVNLLKENNLLSAVVSQDGRGNVVLTSQAVYKSVTSRSLSAVFCVSSGGHTLPKAPEPRPPVEPSDSSSLKSDTAEDDMSTKPCSSSRSTQRITIRPPPRRHRRKHIRIIQQAPPAPCPSPAPEYPQTRDILVIRCSYGKIAIVDEYEKYVRNPQLANVMCHKLQPYLEHHMVESPKYVLSNKTSRSSIDSHHSSSDSSDSSYSDSYREYSSKMYRPKRRRDVRRYHRRADCDRHGKELYDSHHKRPDDDSRSDVDYNDTIRPRKCRRHKRFQCRKRRCRKYN